MHAAAASEPIWRVERVAHPALPLLLATDEDGAVVFVGFVGKTGSAASELAQRANRVGARLVDGGDDRSVAHLQLLDFLDGKRREFDVPVVLHGTDFQREAWEALRAIPYGHTRTYGEQAVAIGRPTAVRAVGSANGDNPIPIIFPCHRVIGADGSLTGFGGGVEVKRWLLELERRAQPPRWKPKTSSPRHSTEQRSLF